MKKLSMLMFLFVLAAGSAMVSAPAHAHAQALLKQGSSGDYVWDLQYRLKTLGLFDQGLTGYFGTHTRQAVVKFQKRYGLRADGVVGRIVAAGGEPRRPGDVAPDVASSCRREGDGRDGRPCRAPAAQAVASSRRR